MVTGSTRDFDVLEPTRSPTLPADEHGIKPWDVAAGSLLVVEAGGVVMDMDGSPCDVTSGRILCAGSLDLAVALSKMIVPPPLAPPQ